MREPVAVVVVTWNSAHEIESCLRSALAEAPAELVVVDNGSRDGTPDLVRARFGADARVLCQERNRGFADGCNAGIAATTAPFVLLLNADARLQGGYLPILRRALEGDANAASATGKLVYEERGERFIDSAGIELHAHALRPLDRGFGERDRGQYDRPERIFGPSGAAALYRRAALDDVGGGPFDADLFAYYEDVDLAWRLSRKGWHHLYEPEALGWHRRRGPDEKPAEIAARAFANRYLVFLRNESPLRFARYAAIALPWEAARILRRALHRPTLLRGIPDALRRAPGVLRKRWGEGR